MLVTDVRFRDKVSSLTLDDLIFIKKLGEGQFGHVFLVKGRTTGELYALKAVSKIQIVEQNLQKHTLQEKNVLQLISYPLIMKMHRTFKDRDFVYFLLSFIRGMELFDVIRAMGNFILIKDLLDNDQSRYYISSMILAMEYLHKQRIVYRDIKPENIMIDHTGKLHLIDMGTAKVLGAKSGIKRTFTIIGTPHYMAPEILKGKGYGLMVDLWSIGNYNIEARCGAL